MAQSIASKSISTPLVAYIREKILAIPTGSLMPSTALGKLIVKRYPHITLHNAYNRINLVLAEEAFAENYERIKGRPKNEKKVAPKTYIRKKT